jgi:hypothetical protein
MSEGRAPAPVTAGGPPAAGGRRPLPGRGLPCGHRRRRPGAARPASGRPPGCGGSGVARGRGTGPRCGAGHRTEARYP